MEAQDVAAQVFAIQVRVDLRRGEAGMTEHLLHSAQIGTAFDQVRSERMTEGVWADVLANMCLLCETFHKLQDAYTR